MKCLFFSFFVFLFCGSVFSQGEGLTKKQLKDIEFIMTPLRLKVENNLKAKDAKMYQSYQQDMLEALKTQDESKRKLAMANLKTKYYSFVEAGYNNANIDEKDIKAKLALILNGLDFKITNFLGVRVVFNGPTTPETGNSCKEYHCRFSQRSNTSDATFIGGGGGTSQSSCGMSVNSCAIIVGSKKDEVAAGENVSVNAGIVRFEISAQADYYIRLFASACLGGSYAKGYYGFKVSQGNNTSMINLRGAEIVAPVVWCDEFTDEIANDAVATTIAVQGGATYKVQLCATSEAFTANVMGGGDSDVVLSNIDYLKVCQVAK